MFGTREKSVPHLVTSSETVEIDRSPETVMSFLLTPESGVITGESVERCFRAPDTPTRAIGEQHVSVSREGDVLRVDVDEIVALDFPHSCETINLTSPGEIRVRYTCEPLDDGGTRYTQAVRILVQPREARITQSLFDGETLRCVHRIKAVMENDEWTPSDER